MLLTLLLTFILGLPSPAEDFLQGCWQYDGNVPIFLEEEGQMPDKESIDNCLYNMTVTADNCDLKFFAGQKCSFRVGRKEFGLKWSLDPKTREFRATYGVFSITGYLVRDGERLALIYSKSKLEMMMYYLCPISTYRSVRELCRILGKQDGLTLCIYFKRRLPVV